MFLMRSLNWNVLSGIEILQELNYRNFLIDVADWNY